MKELLRTGEHSLAALLGKQIRTARRRAAALSLLRATIEDPAGEAFLALLAGLERLLASGGPPQGGTELATLYARVFSLLAEAADPAVEGADAWQSHLLWRVIDDANSFSRAAERDGARGVPASLLQAAQRDLRTLQWLYSLSADALREATQEALGEDLAESLTPWQELAPPASGDPARLALARRLSTALDWGALAGELADHWRRHGLGLFARFRAARWSTDARALEGLAHPDDARLESLYAYDRERAPLLRNTERFVAGLPAQHALLYGERGTGKSSTVKALLNRHAPAGLRLVELGRDHLGDLPRVLALLRDHPQRFILFVDDLSFEEHELQYKALKAALEGGVEAWPRNVVLYVTTNRRHLIKERFADRQLTGDEIRPRDSEEEKLSLADRFGLTVTFPAPDQERYVTIVTALAHAAGIDAPDDELRQRAIKWTLWHNGRSGRTARQFVDDLLAEQRTLQEQP